MANREPEIACLTYDVCDTLSVYRSDLVAKSLGRLSSKGEEGVNELLYGGVGRDYSPENLAYKADMGWLDEQGFIDGIRNGLEIPHWIRDDRIVQGLQFFEFEGRMRTLLHFLSGRKMRNPDGKEIDCPEQPDGLVLGLVTNLNKLQWDYVEGAFPTIARNGRVLTFHVLSWEDHILKPDRGIFEISFARACSVYYEKHKKELRPEQCLFFDDREVNINAAEDFGMRVHPVQKEAMYESICRGLAEHGLPLPSPNYYPPATDKQNNRYGY